MNNLLFFTQYGLLTLDENIIIIKVNCVHLKKNHTINDNVLF
jgi:hypothetical protein